VSVTDLSFAAALQRLGDIRRDLQEVADPDIVDALEQEANGLAEHCRDLLRRPRSTRPRHQQAVATDTGLAREQGSQPFDQFAEPEAAEPSSDQRTPPRQDDDATVSIPVPSGRSSEAEAPTEEVGGGTGQIRKRTGDDAPTEAVESARRTITLPGDAPTEQSDSDDDTPTGVLHPPR
jgi:hypothetical protein